MFDDFIYELEKTKLIALTALPDPSLALPYAQAVNRGGVNHIEITFRNENAAQSIKNIKDGNINIKLGAGTVRSIEQADIALKLECDFIVTPGFNEKVIKHVLKESSVPIFPGIDSTLGIEKALDLGLNYLKMFPATVIGGVNWLKAISGPYFDVKFIPTGGVSMDNLEQFIKQKNVVACGGSFLTPKEFINTHNWSLISGLCRQAVIISRNFSP